jgi:hypothetical protein
MWNFENIEEKAEQASKEGFNIELGAIISEAWGIFKQFSIGFIGVTVLFLVSSSLPDFLLGDEIQMQIIKQFIGFLFFPLYLGYAIVTYKIINNEAYSFSDFFGAYTKFLPLMMLYILYLLLVLFGLILLIIPGIYLAIVLFFSSYVFYFGNKSIRDSFIISRKFIHRNFWEFFIFTIAIGIFSILGILAPGVGLLVTVPVGIISFALYFYKGLASTNEENSVENHLI